MIEKNLPLHSAKRRESIALSTAKAMVEHLANQIDKGYDILDDIEAQGKRLFSVEQMLDDLEANIDLAEDDLERLQRKWCTFCLSPGGRKKKNLRKKEAKKRERQLAEAADMQEVREEYKADYIQEPPTTTMINTLSDEPSPVELQLDECLQSARKSAQELKFIIRNISLELFFQVDDIQRIQLLMDDQQRRLKELNDASDIALERADK